MTIKKLCVVAIGLAMLLSPLVASAQRGAKKPLGVAQRAVKPATVEFVGTLESIEIGPCEQTPGRATVGVHLIVVTESGEKRDIHLGPVAVAQQWVESLQIGEELVVQAFATNEHAKDHYIAVRLDMNRVVIQVRDATLQPSWARGNRGCQQGNLGQGGGRPAAADRPCATSDTGCGCGVCRQWDVGKANSDFSGEKARTTAGPGRGCGQGMATRQGRGQGSGPGEGRWQGRGAGGQGQFGRQGQPGFAPAVASKQNPDATGMEIEHILFVREEEKLARDVYLTLAQRWGRRIFDNIAKAEQRPMDAMRMLIESYNLVDPVTNDAVGVFTDSTLQRLYDDLTSDHVADLSYLKLDFTIEGGANSELAALKVGAFVEEFDILDILRRQEDLTRPDVTLVYENLLRASRNHLRAFASLIQTSGAVYQSILMTGSNAQLGDLEALYLDIIASDRETGKQQGRSGRGVNNGLPSSVNGHWMTELGKRSSRKGGSRVSRSVPGVIDDPTSSGAPAT